jgi:deoxyribodipyrimidine photo-lyase
VNVASIRIAEANDAPVRSGGELVLYWMIAYRRTGWNFAIQRAADWARELAKPLVVLEAVRCDYPWASDRLHRFIIDGMADNARRLASSAAFYYPYVEPGPGAGRGLLEALASRACVVVTDDFPSFFLPHAVAVAAKRLPVRLEQVDSVGLLPMRTADRAFTTAHSFRLFLQKRLPDHLEELPEANPLGSLGVPSPTSPPEEVTRRWPPSRVHLPTRNPVVVQTMPIDHTVPVVDVRGGASAAEAALRDFVESRLPRYDRDRNHPDEDATSGLSPYLHFGHVSAHEVFTEVMKAEGWSAARLSLPADGSRRGWWGAGESAEAFLDQLLTWRELGFNFCHHRSDYDQFESLPGWARETLEEHSGDARPYTYSVEKLEAAATHDDVWNTAQRQLLQEGRIHNYLRMLWGKKILEWRPSPREALAAMIHLNNKYALDGRDPNSYSGIFWCLGRYDRAWGPERPVFGKVRYMSSENTKRKLRMKGYLDAHPDASAH